MVSTVLEAEEIRDLSLGNQRRLSLALVAAVGLHLLLGVAWIAFEHRHVAQPLSVPAQPVIHATLLPAVAPAPTKRVAQAVPAAVTPPPPPPPKRVAAAEPQLSTTTPAEVPEAPLPPPQPPEQEHPQPQPQIQPPPPASAAVEESKVAADEGAEVAKASSPEAAPSTQQVEELVQEEDGGAVEEQPYTPPSSRIAYAHNPKPNYPRAVRNRGIEGVVELLVQVDESGLPVTVDVKHSSGFGVLDREAVKAVTKWRFEPARRGGVAVAGEVVVPIRFQLSRS